MCSYCGLHYFWLLNHEFKPHMQLLPAKVHFSHSFNDFCKYMMYYKPFLWVCVTNSTIVFLKPQDDFDIILLSASLRERLKSVQYLRGWWRLELLQVVGRTEVGSEVGATPGPHWWGHKEGAAQSTLKQHSREGERLTDKSRERGLMSGAMVDCVESLL